MDHSDAARSRSRRPTLREGCALTESTDNDLQIHFVDQLLIGFAINAYLFALTQPVVYESSGTTRWTYGLHAFVGVYLPVFFYPNSYYFPTFLYPGWYANPMGLIALGLTFTRFSATAWVFSIAALALSFLPLARFLPYQMSPLGPGYYLWSGSFLCLSLVNLHQRYQQGHVPRPLPKATTQHTGTVVPAQS